jgi:NAD(P)-dependent dehydrogenase (short-subunit alcohol dehydrogenase family)
MLPSAPGGPHRGQAGPPRGLAEPPAPLGRGGGELVADPGEPPGLLPQAALPFGVAGTLAGPEQHRVARELAPATRPDVGAAGNARIGRCSRQRQRAYRRRVGDGPGQSPGRAPEQLAASAPARVVTVASDAHYQATGVDFAAVRRPTASITGMPEYAVSKLCNVLFSAELARRTAGRGITTYAVHPGVVASDIWRRVPWPVRPLIKLRMLSPEQGAATSLYCATCSPVTAVSGRYYENSREREPSSIATPDLARALWEHSQAWVTADPAAPP